MSLASNLFYAAVNGDHAAFLALQDHLAECGYENPMGAIVHALYNPSVASEPDFGPRWSSVSIDATTASAHVRWR